METSNGGSAVPSRSDVEERVRQQLTPPLQDWLMLASETESLAHQCLSAAFEREPQLADVVRVQATLMARAVEDMRVCVIAARTGYTMQAMTVAASCFEASYAMGYVGVNEERAQQWLDHKDIRTHPWTVRACVSETMKYLLDDFASGSESAVEAEYGLYRVLCAAKHTNPLPESGRRWQLSAESATLVLFPFYSEVVLWEARHAITVASRAAATALWVLHKSFLEDRPEEEKSIRELLERMDTLIQRYGTTHQVDPV